MQVKMSQLVLPFLAGSESSAPALGLRAQTAAPRARSQRQPESALVSALGSALASTQPPVLRKQPPAPRVDLFLSSAQLLAEKIERDLEEAVEVELTDNAWTMVSYKRVLGRLRFRLHHMFCTAPDEVVRALAGFTGCARKAARVSTIDAFIRKKSDVDQVPRLARTRALHTRGQVHDLAEMYARLNEQLFGNRIDARIGWGRRAPDRRRCSIKMGVYLHDQRLIRIHSALDRCAGAAAVRRVGGVPRDAVPRAIPPQGGEDGRRCVSTVRSFAPPSGDSPSSDEARAWEKSHLHLLLRKSL